MVNLKKVPGIPQYEEVLIFSKSCMLSNLFRNRGLSNSFGTIDLEAKKVLKS